MTYHCVCCATSGDPWTKFNVTFLYQGTSLCSLCLDNACDHPRKYGPGETLPTSPVMNQPNQ